MPGGHTDKAKNLHLISVLEDAQSRELKWFRAGFVFYSFQPGLRLEPLPSRPGGTFGFLEAQDNNPRLPIRPSGMGGAEPGGDCKTLFLRGCCGFQGAFLAFFTLGYLCHGCTWAPLLCLVLAACFHLVTEDK